MSKDAQDLKKKVTKARFAGIFFCNIIARIVEGGGALGPPVFLGLRAIKLIIYLYFLLFYDNHIPNLTEISLSN